MLVIPQNQRTLTSDHIGDLNDGICLRFRKDTFSSSTFDIKTEDT